MTMNKVIIVGRLGQDPEINHTKKGNPVANFSVATKNYDKTTEWHRMVAFGNPAKFVGDYMRKGDLVAVEGEIRTEKWEDKNGNNRYTTKIYVSRVQSLGGRKDRDGDGTGRKVTDGQHEQIKANGYAPDNNPNDEYEEDLPF